MFHHFQDHPPPSSTKDFVCFRDDYFSHKTEPYTLPLKWIFLLDINNYKNNICNINNKHDNLIWIYVFPEIVFGCVDHVVFLFTIQAITSNNFLPVTRLGACCGLPLSSSGVGVSLLTAGIFQGWGSGKMEKRRNQP